MGPPRYFPSVKAVKARIDQLVARARRNKALYGD